MSKPSRRPGREEIKERARKKRQHRLLRQQQREAGLSPHAAPTPSNSKSRLQSIEKEGAARTEAVTGLILIMRQMLPVLLGRLGRIPDPRNPKKLKHRLTVCYVPPLNRLSRLRNPRIRQGLAWNILR